MRVAIYARKSKATDKGESINNQIELCKSYIDMYNQDAQITIYKDEGFTGANTERPDFQRLLMDIKSNKFDVLICYRLDRISRSVADFSNIYTMLQKHNVEFISVKEQFDTSSPMGRAMLNISMTFAQLERETIAERINDNMYALAKTGRWLGGKAPYGYTIERYAGDNGKKMSRLIKTDNIDLVKLIFEKFCDIGTLNGVSKYFNREGIKSFDNKYFTPTQIKDILINPVYASCDSVAYNYFNSMGATVVGSLEEWNGNTAIMPYGKHKKSTRASKDNWVVVPGTHDYLITGTEYVAIQHMLNANTNTAFRTNVKADYGILSGLVKCKCCGAPMRLRPNKVLADGTKSFAYICKTKDTTKAKDCNVKNLLGHEADKDVLDMVGNWLHDPDYLATLDVDNLAKNTNNPTLKKELEAVNTKIDNLMNILADMDPNSSFKENYLAKLGELDKQKADLLINIEKNTIFEDRLKISKLNTEAILNALKTISSSRDVLSVHEMRLLLRKVIEKIEWDGVSMNIVPKQCL